MKYLLFVWLMAPGQPAESGWLEYQSKAQCEIKRSWYLQRLGFEVGK